MRTSLFALAAFFLVLFNLTAQDSASVVPKREYSTKPIGNEQPPVIDGLLDDTVWNTIEWGGDFIEQRPDENTAPDHQTRFKILYDQKSLYIAIRCFDAEPDKIVRRLSRRDGFRRGLGGCIY